MHHGDILAAGLEAIGGFQPAQAAADNDGVLECRRSFDHGVGIADVAIGQHAFQILAGYGQDERVGAGGKQQAVVLLLGAILGNHPSCTPINFDDLLSQVKTNAIGGIPIFIIEHDLLECHFSGEHRREQDTVVIGMRLRAKYADVVLVGRDLEQLLQRADAGHSIPDHYQFHAGFHALHRSIPKNKFIGPSLRRRAGHCARH